MKIERGGFKDEQPLGVTAAFQEIEKLAVKFGREEITGKEYILQSEVL